jgi:hypothetical protein
MRINFGKLKALGDFRNWFIMSNKEMILNKEISPLDLAGKILAEAYQYASIPIPEWFKEALPENQLEESLSYNSVDVKHAFEAYITNNFDHALSYFRSEKLAKNDVTDLDLNSYKNISTRLIKLIESNRLPHIKRDKRGNILLYRGILEELYKFGVTKDQIPNLEALADYLGGEYGFQHGYRVVKCTANQLESYFDSLPGESR